MARMNLNLRRDAPGVSVFWMILGAGAVVFLLVGTWVYLSGDAEVERQDPDIVAGEGDDPPGTTSFTGGEVADEAEAPALPDEVGETVGEAEAEGDAAEGDAVEVEAAEDTESGNAGEAEGTGDAEAGGEPAAVIVGGADDESAPAAEAEEPAAEEPAAEDAGAEDAGAEAPVEDEAEPAEPAVEEEQQ